MRASSAAGWEPPLAAAASALADLIRVFGSKSFLNEVGLFSELGAAFSNAVAAGCPTAADHHRPRRGLTCTPYSLDS